jgi:hypothetical protein
LDCVPTEYNFTSFMMLNYCVKAPHLGLKLSVALQTQEERNSFLIYICTHSSIGQWPSCVLNPRFSFSLVIILSLVHVLNSPRTSPMGPFLKPLITDTYAAHECCQIASQTSPTFRLATQVVMGTTPQWSILGPQLGDSSHSLEGLPRRACQLPSTWVNPKP